MTSLPFVESWEQHCRAVARANETNKFIVFDALSTAAGITAITVSFDGEGDSGQLN